ncbi:24516_t:CDS:2, partial [Gigaspora rosea]
NSSPQLSQVKSTLLKQSLDSVQNLNENGAKKPLANCPSSHYNSRSKNDTICSYLVYVKNCN